MAKRDAPRHRGPRDRIDWAAAETFWLALDPPRSFGRVARHFGVSDTAVRNQALRRGWRDTAEKLDAEMRERAINRIRLSREQRVEKALRIVDGLLVEADARVIELGRELKPGDLPAIVKLAELLEGEATDRVAIEEVRGVIVAVVHVAGRYVPRERRPEFLAELEQATGGLAGIEGEEPGS